MSDDDSHEDEAVMPSQGVFRSIHENLSRYAQITIKWQKNKK